MNNHSSSITAQKAQQLLRLGAIVGNAWCCGRGGSWRNAAKGLGRRLFKMDSARITHWSNVSHTRNIQRHPETSRNHIGSELRSCMSLHAWIDLCKAARSSWVWSMRRCNMTNSLQKLLLHALQTTIKPRVIVSHFLSMFDDLFVTVFVTFCRSVAL